MKNYIIFFFIVFYTNYSLSNNIATINLDYIIDNCKSFQNFLLSIDDFHKEKKNDLKKIEIKLNDEKRNIESMKDIVILEEFEKLVYDFNIKLNNFQFEIQNFNLTIDENINKNRKIIINQIVEILKDISLSENYDLILSNEHYIISQSQNDISNNVLNILNNKKIELKIFNSES